MQPVIPKVFITFLPVMIFFLIAVVFVMIALLKLFHKRPWIAAIAGLTTLLIVSWLLYRIRAIRSYDDRAPRQTATQVAAPTSVIWLPGIEEQFEADVYPSKVAAVRALALRIHEPIRRVFKGEPPLPLKIILFQGAHERALLEELGKAIGKAMPEAQWSIVSETAAVEKNQAAIRLELLDVETQSVPWAQNFGRKPAGGVMQANIVTSDSQAFARAKFIEKPWVDDFANFVNSMPDARFVLATSTGSSLSESEADAQAVQNACWHLTSLLRGVLAQSRRPPFNRAVMPADLREGGFVVDQFVQSFNGTAGLIWRKALLIDASADKLRRLQDRIAVQVQVQKITWAKTIGSVFGLLVLISVAYLFLNAATRGYYVWSLRIAAIALAFVGIGSIILLLA
jgi:hypothetical protein